MPARPSWLIFAVLAFVCCLPGIFLYYYQQKFGFHPLIIIFGQAAVLLAVALLGLVVLGMGFLHPAGRTVHARLLGVALALLVGVLVLVFAGAYISNSVWGDTLNYGIVLTFAAHSGAILDFLPLVPAQKKYLLAGLLTAGALCLLLTFIATVKLSSRLLPQVDRWLSEPAAGNRRRVGLSGVLAATVAVAGAVCTMIILVSPRSLYGEPISGFFKLVSASSLLHLDNARLAAALEDRGSRIAYRKPAGFHGKHVIVIFSDALRADRMGVYGYPRATTPFLSELYAAKRLHRVEMALSTCSESFCGIASTLASRPFHQISNHNFKLHALLRDVGYRVNFFLTGDHRGWNYLFDFYGTDVDTIHDHKTLNPKDIHDDRAVLDALDRISDAGAQPNFFYFFLMSSHMSGHRMPEFERFQPTHTDAMRMVTFWNELAGTQRIEGEGIKQQRIGRQDLEAISNRYDNGVLQTDAYLRRIFATLEAKGYLRDSIVVILGDHGEGLGEHGHIGHTRYLFQEDIRIPLLIHGGDIARYRNDAFAAQIDIAPTILDSIGLPVPSGWQGQSLMKPPGRRMTLHQTRRGRTPCFAVVERTDASLMKYIRCGDAGLRSYEALFDLRADPGEQNNLVASADARRLERYRREIDGRFSVIVNRCMGFECQD